MFGPRAECLSRLFQLLVWAMLIGLAGPARADRRCETLFRQVPSPTLWIHELIELRNDIANSSGPLRVALTDQWNQRLQNLGPGDLEVLTSTLRRKAGVKIIEETKKAEDSNAHRAEQSDRLMFLPKTRLKAVVTNISDFMDLKLGFSDQSPFFDSWKASHHAGIQWGLAGQFAAFRQLERSTKTIIIDLGSGAQRVVPFKGRLSAEGNIFVGFKDLSNSTVIDLRTGRTWELRGSASLDDRMSVTDTKILTTVTDGQGRVVEHYYHDLSGSETTSYKLGAEVAWNESLQRIATLIDGRLQVFDTQLRKFIEHPVSQRKIFDTNMKSSLASGLVTFTEWHGIPGFRSMRKMLLRLDDLKVHQLSENSREWSPIEGTDLVFMKSEPNSRIPQVTSVRSLVTGQVIQSSQKFPGRPDVHFDQDVIWIKVGEDLFRQNRLTLEIQHQMLLPGDLSFNDAGLFEKREQDRIQFYDPVQKNWLEVPTPRRGSFAVVQREQDRLFFVQTTERGSYQLFEIGMDGFIRGQMEASFVAFSRDSKWIAIGKGGKIEIHSIAP